MCIRDSGYTGFTVEDLAAAVGVSRRTLFNHVASKEEAVLGALPVLTDEQAQTLRSGGPTGDLFEDLLETALRCLRADEHDLEDWQLGGAESTTASRTRSAEAEAIDHMPASAVKDALQQIPEDFRLAVYLADVEGFAYQEIADIMKTPIGTVMSRLHRGRRMLRDLLADYARERGIEVPAATPSRSKR